jgi:hypothetical protein
MHETCRSIPSMKKGGGGKKGEERKIRKYVCVLKHTCFQEVVFPPYPKDASTSYIYSSSHLLFIHSTIISRCTVILPAMHRLYG